VTEDAVTYMVAVLAAIVAFQYFVIGLYVVPRLGRLADEPGPLLRMGQIGASGFLLGCGLTHVGLMVHTLTGDAAGYGNNWHTVIAHVVPHLLQVVGGATFIIIVATRLDVRISSKNFVRLQEEREQLLVRLQHLATHDELTGLLNRRAFDEEYAQHLRYAERYGASGGVIYTDLDGFKQANDNHGHATGDALLVTIADCLRKYTRDTDSVGRMGGDEFAILLREAGPQECAGTAERLVRELGRITDPAPIKASAGVASCATFPQALEAADAAMYVAKRAGGDRYVVAA
jgi:diguanylate cyclase (GGDEF)-like protein